MNRGFQGRRSPAGLGADGRLATAYEDLPDFGVRWRAYRITNRPSRLKIGAPFVICDPPALRKAVEDREGQVIRAQPVARRNGEEGRVEGGHGRRGRILLRPRGFLLRCLLRESYEGQESYGGQAEGQIFDFGKELGRASRWGSAGLLRIGNPGRCPGLWYVTPLGF